MPKIVIHEKALAHLSRGLYRSPASALRELVSNAWDANATNVLVSTNYPSFMQLSIHDNGDGFSAAEFQALMEGGIGNSDKRLSSQPVLINGRPLIGRLGIGLLGIAQICGSFDISSKPKSGEPFTARVRLYDLIRERLDTDNPEVVKEVKDDQAHVLREVDIGTYDFVPWDAAAGPKRGTRITSDDVHPTFVQSFQDSLKLASFKEPPLDWAKCLAIVSRVHSLHELGDYWKLLWELAASCPIPYVGADAVPHSAVKDVQARLTAYGFTVRVDGITLAKPVRLKGNKAGYTVQKIPITKQTVYGKRVEFEGYIAVQEGRQLKPDELRGIMIRIKNIGIGYYDPSFLDYPWNQGPREKWVTGEIFVHAGLEDALNVDRDSFNKFHPEFRAVQKTVHEVLQKQVFPEVYKQLSQRSENKAQERAESRLTHFRDVLSESLGKKVRVKSSPRSTNGDPVSVDESSEQVQVHFGDLNDLRTRKSQRPLAAAIFALYDIASRSRGSSQQRERFRELLLALLSRW